MPEESEQRRFGRFDLSLFPKHLFLAVVDELMWSFACEVFCLERLRKCAQWLTASRLLKGFDSMATRERMRTSPQRRASEELVGDAQLPRSHSPPISQLHMEKRW